MWEELCCLFCLSWIYLRWELGNLDFKAIWPLLRKRCRWEQNLHLIIAGIVEYQICGRRLLSVNRWHCPLSLVTPELWRSTLTTGSDSLLKPGFSKNSNKQSCFIVVLYWTCSFFSFCFLFWKILSRYTRRSWTEQRYSWGERCFIVPSFFHHFLLTASVPEFSWGRSLFIARGGGAANSSLIMTRW